MIVFIMELPPFALTEIDTSATSFSEYSSWCMPGASAPLSLPTKIV